jgi:surface antigen
MSKRINIPVLAAVLTALVAALLLAAPTSASAAKGKPAKVICKGFSACEKKKRTTHGYRAVYKTQHWGAVAGHNCTNYVAYRLTNRGRVTDRAHTIGSASEWGITLPKAGVASLTNKPKVGDVAWWSYHRKHSRRSHVAYVERVYKDGSVLVSEDNYKGDFYYTRYFRGHKSFPSSFLRFKKSTGSPRGKVKAAKATKNVVRVDAWHAEADSKKGAVGLVSFGAPRGHKDAVEVRTSRKVEGSWWASAAFNATKMPKVAYVYALNSAGTRGSDTLLAKVQVK